MTFSGCGCPVGTGGVVHRWNCPQHVQPARTAATISPAGSSWTIGDKPFTGSRQSLLEQIGRELLFALGEDPDREGLRDTPRRFAQMWLEFIQFDPGKTDTTFEAIQADQLVIVGPMRVWSKCEHHLVDFWCDVTVGYLPKAKVLGLSKFARVAHAKAHRLQLQERLVTQIADELVDIAETEDVAVLARGEHLCMTARGVRTPAVVTSSSLNGVFRSNPDTRREFLSLATERSRT